MHDVEGWRENYQRTTRLWWERLNARRAEAEAMVGAEKTRLWLMYLAGVSLAFGRGGLFINQTLASKRSKGRPACPSPARTSTAEWRNAPTRGASMQQPKADRVHFFTNMSSLP